MDKEKSGNSVIFEPGETVFFLSNYDLLPAIVERPVRSRQTSEISSYMLRVNFPWGLDNVLVRVKSDKMAGKEELIAPVWEMNSGRNGRGAYRIERILYKEYLRPAKMWGRQERLSEESPGVLFLPLCNLKKWDPLVR